MPKPKLPIATPEQFEGNTLMRMTTRNIKRVRYIDITLNQPLTIIGGEEEAGKTSYIDSFGFCMSGKLAIQMQPIRNGQQEGWVRCDFGDGQDIKLSVTRTLKRVGESDFTADVSVKIPGHIAPSQLETFLRKLTSEKAFDPSEFDSMSNEDKFKSIQSLIGNLNFTTHAANRKKIFDQRTEVGRDWGREQSAADAIVLPEEPPYDADAEKTITLELEEAGKKNTDRAIRAANRESAATKIQALRDISNKVEDQIAAMKSGHMATYEVTERDTEEQIKDMERQIRQLQERIEGARKRISDAHIAMLSNIERDEKNLASEALYMRGEANTLQQKLDAAGPLADVIDPAAIMTRLAATRNASSEHAAWAQLRDRRAEYLEKSAEHNKEWDRLTKQLDDMDAAKQRAIESAKLPVKGLGVGDGYLTLEAPDGSGATPWDQASESRRAAASFDLAMAMNPKLKVILIRSGSGISKRTRQYIQQRAVENKYQVILEVVDECEGTTVVIEDGHVRGQSDAPPLTVIDAPVIPEEVECVAQPDLSSWRT